MNQSGDDIEDFKNDCIDMELHLQQALDIPDDFTCITNDVIDEDTSEWTECCETIEVNDEDRNIFFLHLENPQRVVSESPASVAASMDKNKFDSRTFVRPKKSNHRPSLQAIVDGGAPVATGPSLTSRLSALMQGLRTTPSNKDKYLTYNKYNSPFTNIMAAEGRKNSMSASQDQDDLLNTSAISLVDSISSEHPHPSQPITIDLTQPTSHFSPFRRGRDMGMSLKGESFASMSPPSLVQSIVDDEEYRKSLTGATPRESLDNHNSLMTSMTMSILDEKDMNTSFLSTTTQQDYDSLGSVSASLISSINSSFSAQNLLKKPEETNNSSSFAALLEPSERLMNRPRISLYKNIARNESNKSIDDPIIEKIDNNDIDMTKDCDKIVDDLTHDNRNDKSDEKENFNSSFEVYKNHPLLDLGRNSLNITMDKKELNEIIQAKEKLSNARKALPRDGFSPNRTQTLLERDSISQARMPGPILKPTKLNQTVDLSPRNLHDRTVEMLKKLPASDTTVTLNSSTQLAIPRKSLDNSNDIITRRRDDDVKRETPKRNGTFRLASPARQDATVIHVKDGDSTAHYSPQRTLTADEWRNEPTMTVSSDSTDASSASPPDAGDHYANAAMQQQRLLQVNSTPLSKVKSSRNHDLLKTMNTISPILVQQETPSDVVRRNSPMRQGTHGANLIKQVDSTTMVRRRKEVCPVPTKSDFTVLAMANRKSGLPTSKQRQYSSHRDLSRMPVAGPLGKTKSGGVIYSSNPALSPTQPQLMRRDSYTIATHNVDLENRPRDKPPSLVRQATETFKRPQSQLITPKDIRMAQNDCSQTPVRRRSSQQAVQVSTRPVSVASHTQISRVRPPTVTQKPVPASLGKIPVQEQRGLPRPSRLPAPRTRLRPPSVYSVAPSAGDMGDHY